MTKYTIQRRLVPMPLAHGQRKPTTSWLYDLARDGVEIITGLHSLKSANKAVKRDAAQRGITPYYVERAWSIGGQDQSRSRQ